MAELSPVLILVLGYWESSVVGHVYGRDHQVFQKVRHGLPIVTTSISDELQQVLHGVGRQHANNIIETHSSLRYTNIVIAHVNWEE